MALHPDCLRTALLLAALGSEDGDSGVALGSSPPLWSGSLRRGLPRARACASVEVPSRAVLLHIVDNLPQRAEPVHLSCLARRRMNLNHGPESSNTTAGAQATPSLTRQDVITSITMKNFRA